MGSVVQRKTRRGPVWYAVYRVDGKQRWEKVPPDYTGKRGALRFLSEREASQDRRSRLLFETAADHWLETVKVRLKQTSYAVYEQGLRLHLKPYFAGRRLDQIKPADVQQMVLDLHQGGLSVAYIRRAVVLAIRGIYDMAVQHELTTRDPSRIRLVYPKDTPRQVPMALTAEQVRALLQNLDPYWWPVFVVSVWTGMRIGEVLAMRWCYLSLDDLRYYVEETLTQDRRFTSPKNDASQAPVPLSPYVCQVLVDQRQQVAAEQLQTPDWEDNDLVFPGTKGKPRLYRVALNYFKAACRGASLPETLRIHDLRHTCASLLIAQGADVKTVSEQLRHASITITLDTYGHLFPEQRDSAVEKLDELLGVV